jgi:hypothetical protein
VYRLLLTIINKWNKDLCVGFDKENPTIIIGTCTMQVKLELQTLHQLASILPRWRIVVEWTQLIGNEIKKLSRNGETNNDLPANSSGCITQQFCVSTHSPSKSYLQHCTNPTNVHLMLHNGLWLSKLLCACQTLWKGGPYYFDVCGLSTTHIIHVPSSCQDLNKMIMTT